MKIMLDPGHGGSDPGAVGATGTPEKDISLSISLQMAGLLGMNFEHECHLTRYGGNFLSLQQRCDIANGWEANVFVSMHCNSFSVPSANGFEVFTNPDLDPADYLATEMWNRFRHMFPDMRGRVDLSDGDPDKESKFYVLVHTDMPAVLFELAFISNPDDEGRLLTPAWQTNAAIVLVDAIRAWGSSNR